MNLPLPSAPPPAPTAFAGYPPATESAARTDSSGDNTSFADLLAGAVRPAQAQSAARASTGSGSPTSATGGHPIEGKPKKPRTKAAASGDPVFSPGKSTGTVEDPASISGNPPAVVAPQPTFEPASAVANSVTLPEIGNSPGPDSVDVMPGGSGVIGQPASALSDSRISAQLTMADGLRVLSDSIGQPSSPGAIANPTAGVPASASSEKIDGGHAAIASGSSAVAAGTLQSAPVPATQNSPEFQPDQANAVSASPFTPASTEGSQVSAGAAEKIAGSPDQQIPGQSIATLAGGALAHSDALLSATEQQVRRPYRSVGITSAERVIDMRKPAETSVPACLDRTTKMEVSAGALFTSTPAGGPVTAPVSRSAVESAAVSVPHAAAAVEATLDAMERTRDAAHQSVELKLTFGDDTPLAVRVELHEGIVRTTFRTDSPELRQALASEWRQTAPSVLATATDRTVRVADPVFGPAADSPDLAGASTGGHANSRQATPSFSPESSFSPASSTRPRIGSQASSAPAIPSRLPTSLRLNAFA